MKKNRTILNSTKKIICSLMAFLVMCSAIFYVPMEVDASEFVPTENSSLAIDVTSTVDLGGAYYNYRVAFSDSLCLADDINNYEILDDSLYEISFTSRLQLDLSESCLVQNFIIRLSSPYSLAFIPSKTVDSYTDSVDRTYIMYGFDIKSSKSVFTSFLLRKSSDASITYEYSLDIDVTNLVNLSDTQLDDYQNGYDIGYEEGFQTGIDSVDTQSFYNNGFQAGINSVDTQSFYDNGFQSGIDSVDTQKYYDSGYEEGYKVGYEKGNWIPPKTNNTLNGTAGFLERFSNSLSNLTDKLFK